MLNPVNELIDLIDKLSKDSDGAGYKIDVTEEWPVEFKEVDGKTVAHRPDPFVMTVKLVIPADVMTKLSR